MPFVRYRLYFLIVSAVLSGTIYAQGPNPDASILFSRMPIGGTARSAGAGGAFSSVGADLSCLDLNPAGLGLYRSSDICITPGIHTSAGESNYDNVNTPGKHTILQLAQGGGEWTKNFSNKDDLSGSYALRSITFGVSVQSQSFDRNQAFNATVTNGTLVDKYTNYSNAVGSVQWAPEPYLLNQVGLIGQNGTTYFSNVHGPVLQSGDLATSGGINRINLGFGANLGGKLYLGLSLGIPIIDYQVTAQMVEQRMTADSTQFQNYQLTSTIDESGVGVTGKVGLIYKPVPWMRLGVAYSLPTWYFMTENYSSDLIYNFDSVGGEQGVTTDPSKYQLRTPMKGTVGASFYLGDHGFLSVDYDFQNLGSTHYHFPGFSYQDTSYNSYMKSTYGFSHTIRVGLEGVIKKFRIRAGYSYTNSPFKSGQNYTNVAYSQSVQSASLGMGFLFKHFYIDLAYVFSYSKDGVSPNFQMPLDQINSEYITHNVLLTLGFKIGRDNSPASQEKKREKSNQPKNPDDFHAF